MNNNWTYNETPKFLREEALKQVKKANKAREGKQFKLVKVCDRPLTYKEVEIKDKIK